jgi:hypothetical protein
MNLWPARTSSVDRIHGNHLGRGLDYMVHSPQSPIQTNEAVLFAKENITHKNHQVFSWWQLVEAYSHIKCITWLLNHSNILAGGKKKVVKTFQFAVLSSHFQRRFTKIYYTLYYYRSFITTIVTSVFCSYVHCWCYPNATAITCHSGFMIESWLDIFLLAKFPVAGVHRNKLTKLWDLLMPNFIYTECAVWYSLSYAPHSVIGYQ